MKMANIWRQLEKNDEVTSKRPRLEFQNENELKLFLLILTAACLKLLLLCIPNASMLHENLVMYIFM